SGDALFAGASASPPSSVQSDTAIQIDLNDDFVSLNADHQTRSSEGVPLGDGEQIMAYEAMLDIQFLLDSDGYSALL
ncbi:MAG: hypothetical protein AAF926_02460, partial [Pseudomonadota bacterium]